MGKNNERGAGLFADYAAHINSEKFLFTPGPASLSSQNLEGLGPCFGRGDEEYQALEDRVLQFLKEMTGHSQIIRLQGSASLGLEIVALNFLYGRVAIVGTGYYSTRLKELTQQAKTWLQKITDIIIVPWEELSEATVYADWVWACPTETSLGLKINIRDISSFARRSKAALALDATASVGLESGHEEAEVVVYSSCKGLFGLTGAAFVAYNNNPANEVHSFYLAVESHKQKKMTGPYHSIQSLQHVLPIHADLRAAVVTNKERFTSQMAPYLMWPGENQPLLCTSVSVRLGSTSGRGVLYQPRSTSRGSVISHLGEVHLGQAASGTILNDLAVLD